MYNDSWVSQSYDGIQRFFKIIQPTKGGLDKFYINTYVW